MSQQTKRVRVPGKLILAGEYAVLAGAPAVVCAVDRYLECTVRSASRWAVEGAGRRWEEGGPDVPELSFARESLRAARDYLEASGRTVPPAELTLGDELRAPGGAKLGLGGSACASVAVVASALAVAGEDVGARKELIFKLAAVAHGRAQGKVGSALDVAASTFGGTLWTWRFDVQALLAAWGAGSGPFARAVDATACPDREALPSPPGLLLAFSGQSASTASLVGRVEEYARRDPSGFAEFVAHTSNLADGLRRALLKGDLPGAAVALSGAGRQLERLGVRAGTVIVSEAHQRILAMAEELGLSGKISGAGGGDSCVVVGLPVQLEALAARLASQGLYAAPIGVDPDGVVVLPG